jgi:arginine/lysine/ornithine decarboxylase
MVDPNKLALLTPGIDRKTGEYLDFGVPATVVANYYGSSESLLRSVISTAFYS